MSSGAPSPPSLQSDYEDTRDTNSSELSTSGIIAYNINQFMDPTQRSINKLSVTSHGVEDILSDGVNYSPADTFAECKTEVLPTVPHSFVQDYNSRDSTGFSIQDILGLPQSYNPSNNQDDLEPRYDYQIPNYETISNSPNNNYGSGPEEVISEDCLDKSDNLFTSAQVTKQVIYNRSYTISEPVQCHQRSLGGEVLKGTARDDDDMRESSFPSQVSYNVL